MILLRRLLTIHIIDLKTNHSINITVEHKFSAEIEPFKQAYIERNFHPPVLFRDIRQMANEKA